jgi:hypothetical protein
MVATKNNASISKKNILINNEFNGPSSSEPSRISPYTSSLNCFVSLSSPTFLIMREVPPGP